MDFVLEHRMPNYIKSLNIDPIKISPFVIRLENFPYFKADLEEGILRGLSSALHRRGDCGHPTRHGANLTSECYLALEGLRVTFNGTARGLDEHNSRTDFKLDVDVGDTTFFVEITGRPGGLVIVEGILFSFRFFFFSSAVIIGGMGNANFREQVQVAEAIGGFKYWGTSLTVREHLDYSALEEVLGPVSNPSRAMKNVVF